MVQNIDDVLQRGEALGGMICVQQYNIHCSAVHTFLGLGCVQTNKVRPVEQSKYNTVSIEENKHYRDKCWVI